MRSTDQQTDLYAMNATDLVAMLTRGEVSAHEVMVSFLDHIDAVNPAVNAVCTLVPREEALVVADRADL